MHFRDAMLRAQIDSLDKGESGLDPSGVASGVSDYTRMADEFARGRSVELVDGGVYYLSQRLDIPSGLRLFCRGQATIKRGTAFASGGADDRTNSIVRVAGAATGTVNTTLSATVPMGQPALALTNASGANLPAAGSWLRTLGDNVADLFGGQSDAEVCDELHHVSDAYVSGTSITLASRTCMQHAIGKPVTSFAPFIGNPTRATVEGIYFDWSGAGTTAVAVELTSAVNVAIRRIAGRNLTRSIVDTKGSKNCRIDEPVNRGDCNATTLFDSAHLVTIDRLWCTGEFGRVNAAGNPRPQVTCDNMCVGISVRNSTMRKVAACFRTWGGIMIVFDGLDAHDVDITEITTRDADAIASNANAVLGSVFDGGPAHIPIATFYFGVTLRGIRATAVTQPHITNQCAIYAHDGWLNDFSDIRIQNKGNSPLSAGSYLVGMIISDTDGIMDNVQFHGVTHGIRTRNAMDRWIIDNMYMNAAAGEGSSGSAPFVFDHQGGLNTGPIFGTVRADNFGVPFYFDTEFLALPDRGIHFKHLYVDGYYGENVYCVNYGAGPDGGSVLRLTGGSPEAVAETTGPSPRNIIAMGAAVNGWGLAAFGDAMAKFTGTAAVRGDILEANNAGQLVVNNSAASVLNARWRAIHASASGFVRAQKVN